MFCLGLAEGQSHGFEEGHGSWAKVYRHQDLARTFDDRLTEVQRMSDSNSTEVRQKLVTGMEIV